MKFTNWRVILTSAVVLSFGAALFYYFVFTEDISTAWHEEVVTAENTSWNGSQRNALNTLKVRSHGWKIIDVNNGGQCEWGFKVVIEFPEHPDYVDTESEEWGGAPIMPVQLLQYDLYDADGFFLTSASLDEKYDGKNEPVIMGEAVTYQDSDKLDRVMARRAAYGKLKVIAGYPWKEGEGILMIKL